MTFVLLYRHSPAMPWLCAQRTFADIDAARAYGDRYLKAWPLRSVRRASALPAEPVA